MRVSQMFIPTLREVPAEAEIISHQLMLRAGLMRKLAAGIYSFLPLGLRALRKFEQIVREEMDRSGALELIMSAVLPAEYYQESGRWAVFGEEMFRFKDRNDRDFCLGPTHEEIFTNAVKCDIKSYRQLPITLYQIQNKYRDEIRPRFGVIRSREFIMKDAYSFDRDERGLDESYQKMYNAYCRIFDRLGLDYIVVDADSGAMGGSGSQEFMVKSEIGEDTIVFCDDCKYAANLEKAVCVANKDAATVELLAIEKVATPNAKTIEELTEFLKTTPDMFAKTLLYVTDEGKHIAAMVRGDRELNETKLQNALGGAKIELMSFSDVEQLTKAEVGFAGSVGLAIPIYVDLEVSEMANAIVGANETGYHLKNINLGRDFKATEVLDLRNIEEGDICPKCGKTVSLARGIEVGHIFKLGTKYTDAMDCTYLDENGEYISMIMGCYGIGVNRSMAAVIEQYNDKNGIVWPMAVAPYHVIVVPVNVTDAVQVELAEGIYNALLAQGIEVILDDRDERPGVKFKDADLIGIPIRITVGKRAAEGIVEYKLRRDGEFSEKSVEDAINSAVSTVKSEI